MLQCQTTTGMAGGSALLRLRLLYRMLRVGELLALAAFLSWSSWYVPSAVAAVIRLAGSLLLNARFVFVLGNAIVLLLFALSRHEHYDLLSSPGYERQQPAAASTATTPPQQASSSVVLPVVSSACSSFPSFATPTASTTLPSSSDGAVQTGAAAASFGTPPNTATEEEEEAAAAKKASLLLEDKDNDKRQPVAAVNKQARAPRRSRSEKMRDHRRRAASPELRRCESENGRRRRSSVTAPDACWGREDADEFRRQVEAFIARQTRFHREESMSTTVAGHCGAAPAFTGALAVVE